MTQSHGIPFRNNFQISPGEIPPESSSSLSMLTSKPFQNLPEISSLHDGSPPIIGVRASMGSVPDQESITTSSIHSHSHSLDLSDSRVLDHIKQMVDHEGGGPSM